VFMFSSLGRLCKISNCHEVTHPEVWEKQEEAAPQAVTQLMFTEAPQKLVTSQDILHLRSPVWLGLDSFKAPEKNIIWMLGRFLIGPFLWREGWKPGSPGIIGTRFTTSSNTCIAKHREL